MAVCYASHLPLSYSTVSLHPIHVIKAPEVWKSHEEWKAPVEEWKAPAQEWKSHEEWKEPAQEWKSHEEWKAPTEWKAPVAEWKEPEAPANYEFSKYTQ